MIWSQRESRKELQISLFEVDKISLSNVECRMGRKENVGICRNIK